MYPIYKFELSANGTTQRAYPNYNEDMALDYELEQGEEFYRAKLSGELTFMADDYTFIRSKAFDTKFGITIYISHDAGATWSQYWVGQFWKTNCEFDEDAETCKVKAETNDIYKAVLDGLEKEYDLIELSPEIVPISADKRPLVQVYVPGQSVIACFLAGMWWEQECEAVSNEYDLENTYLFLYNKGYRVITIVSQSGTPELPKVFMGATPDPRTGSFVYQSGIYSFSVTATTTPGGINYQFRINSNIPLWSYSQTFVTGITFPLEITMQPIGGSGATGTVTVYLQEYAIYSRFLCDTPSINGLPTQLLPDNDLVGDNRNYSRAVGYNFPDTIHFGTAFSATPTQWGLYQPGQYYKAPVSLLYPEMFPVSRNAWGRVSIWFSFSVLDSIVEESGRQPFAMRYTYPLWSVISVLLGKVAPGLTHLGNSNYSQFLYGTTLIAPKQTILITPKSNVVTAGYDQPAQKAPITLREVLSMLRDCFRCYWFIDSQNRFRIEHIQYFMNGGSYGGTPTVGIDLTTEIVTRNGKPWAFAQDKYSFDKPDMAARYQFGWMDDVSLLFRGYPIDILSQYVQQGNIEEITINKFTSDIDYVLLNPSAVSKDGFMLLSAVTKNILSSSIVVQTRSTDGYAKIIDYPASVYGKTATMKVEINAGYADVAYYDSNDNFIAWGDRFFGGQENYIGIDMPDNATYIGVISQVMGATVTVISIIPDRMALAYYNFQDDNGDHILQNAYVAFAWLQNYYAYDMPAYDYEINGEQMTAQSIKRLKTQNVKFPLLTEPNLVNLIKTNIGSGTIQKLSVNLLSRNATATLKYDTE